ncbi:pogo transposable element with KRAB domain [Rhizophagus clarus]|uniref:Pogo transposable element with KRAB domain n=1 Tax=Rhizophagus clarus TaxID=94130 RepID=A0A8H3R0C1_9GLOM|nr:pogo transposable element with KRAB domain [Rhizophagus clarus]
MAGNFTIDNKDGTKFPPICIFKRKQLSCDEQVPSGVIVWFQESGGHLEESVKIKFRDRGIDLAVILGGLTSICQPLDVTINKPFKDNLRKEWHIWMAGGGAGMTVSGNFHRARLSDICGWVKRSWDRIPDEMVIESFKTCRISTSLDESDDEITDNKDYGD